MAIKLIGDVEIPDDRGEAEFSRASGPGGQHVNKTETRVTLRLDLGALDLPPVLKARLLRRLAPRLTKDQVLLVSADAHRERGRNLSDAWQRLAALVAEAAQPPKVRRKTRPTRGSQERRMQAKRRLSDKKKQRRERFD